jgi:hypothetical protein
MAAETTTQDKGNGKSAAPAGAPPAPAQATDAATLAAEVAQLRKDLAAEREARAADARALAEERSAVGVIVGEASGDRIKLSGVIHGKDGKAMSLILTAQDWRALQRVGVPRVMAFAERIGK